MYQVILHPYRKNWNAICFDLCQDVHIKKSLDDFLCPHHTNSYLIFHLLRINKWLHFAQQCNSAEIFLLLFHLALSTISIFYKLQFFVLADTPSSANSDATVLPRSKLSTRRWFSFFNAWCISLVHSVSLREYIVDLAHHSIKACSKKVYHQVLSENESEKASARTQDT